ncbi:putative L-fucose:H+ symporter permease-like protein [Seiridium cardinale]
MFWPTAHFLKSREQASLFRWLLCFSELLRCRHRESGDCLCSSPILSELEWRRLVPLTPDRKFFFEEEHANSLTSVHFVYLAVACAGAAVAVLFFFAKLPDVSEEMLSVDQFDDEIGAWLLYKQRNMIFAFIAQFCYVGAQVTIAAFINYGT